MGQSRALIIPETPDLIPERFAETVCSWLATVESIDTADECRRRAAALRAYVRRREHKYELEAAERWCEVRIGELLRSSNGEHACSPITVSNRRHFHKMADHRPKVAKLIASGVVSRSRILRAIEAKRPAAASGEAVEDPGCIPDDLGAMAAAGKTFGCIYADPPWQYGNQGTRASTDNHYQTMTVEEIAALPIGDLAAPKSHLWLWTTNGFLFECPKLFAAWGFEFKSSYVWVKPQIGIGNYLRNSHELLLLAVRGGLLGQAKDVRSWDQFNRTEHSTKPGQIRTKVIERISPGPYLELFGRRAVPGWSVWGNEVSRDLFTQQLEAV